MSQIYSSTQHVSIHKPLFDRFEGTGPATLQDLARDIADILGARRAFRSYAPGVLRWGLTGIGGFSPGSEKDQELLAAQIAETIEAFEPRLTNVSVRPIGTSGEFRFNVEADLTQEKGQAIRLRVHAPTRGGALGAQVVLLGAND